MSNETPAIESQNCPYCGASVSSDAYDSHVTPCHIAHMQDPWVLGRAAGIRMTYEASMRGYEDRPELPAVNGSMFTKGV